MRRRGLTLTIPARVYNLILATWTAIVFGVAFGCSYHYMAHREADQIVSPPTVKAVGVENETLHRRLNELERQLADNNHGS